jgi:hypothetical protein
MWDVTMSRDCRSNVDSLLRGSLKNLAALRFYISELEPEATYLHMVTKVGFQGFSRRFFAPNLRSAGAALLKKAEVPIPWRT